MNTLVLLLALALSSLFAQQTLNAQTRPLPYDPPEGWQFLRHLDGGAAPIFFYSGDTLIVGSGILEYYSTDAGVTWDSLILPKTYYRGVIPGTVKLYVFHVVDGRWKFGISTDLGKSYTYHDTKIARIPLSGFFVNPHDPNDFIIRLYEEDPHWHTAFIRYGRSTDGGATWNQLILPKPKDGEGEDYKLGFDALRPGVWYLGLSASQWGTVSTLYKSTDNGDSFQELWTRPEGLAFEPFEQIGVDGPGTFRRWWKVNDYTARGVYILDENMKIVDSIDFLAAALGDGLEGLVERFSSFGIKITSFAKDPNRSEILFCRFGGEIRDSAQKILERIQILKRSTNGGSTWESRDTLRTSPQISTLWPFGTTGIARSFDTSDRYSLWRIGVPMQDVASSVISSPSIQVRMAAQGEVTFHILGWHSQVAQLRIVDASGRVMFEGGIRSDSESFEIPALSSLASGLYIVMASAPGIIVSAPFTVAR